MDKTTELQLTQEWDDNGLLASSLVEEPLSFGSSLGFSRIAGLVNVLRTIVKVKRVGGKGGEPFISLVRS